MAYKKIESDYYDERKHVSTQLKRFSDPFEFSKDVSTAAHEAVVEDIKKTGDDLNAKIDAVEVAKLVHKAAIEKEKQVLQSLRSCLEGIKGRDSDEYVAAGGKRQSEVAIQQQQTRESNKKSAEEVAKKAAEAVIQQATDEAIRKALVEAAQKMANTAVQK